jgi:hypothetical protein
MRLGANRAPVLSKVALLLVLASARCVAADTPRYQNATTRKSARSENGSKEMTRLGADRERYNQVVRPSGSRARIRDAVKNYALCQLSYRPAFR